MYSKALQSRPPPRPAASAYQPSKLRALLPREILDIIFSFVLQEDPLTRDSRRLAQLLSIDFTTHDVVRRILRTADGRRIDRPLRIVTAALQEVLINKPRPVLFCQYQLALLRWWPLGRGSSIIIRLHKSAIVSTSNGADQLTEPNGFSLRKFLQPVVVDALQHFSYELVNAGKSNSATALELHNGVLYAIFACHYFFSFVRPGDSIRLSSQYHDQNALAAMIVRIAGQESSAKHDVPFDYDDTTDTLLRLSDECKKELRRMILRIDSWVKEQEAECASSSVYFVDWESAAHLEQIAQELDLIECDSASDLEQLLLNDDDQLSFEEVL